LAQVQFQLLRPLLLLSQLRADGLDAAVLVPQLALQEGDLLHICCCTAAVAAAAAAASCALAAAAAWHRLRGWFITKFKEDALVGRVGCCVLAAAVLLLQSGARAKPATAKSWSDKR
jgi:hypothetical protein